MIVMLKVGMIVTVLPDAEYGGKYTGCWGIIRNYYENGKNKVGVELEKHKNDASSKGLFWFSEDKVKPATPSYAFLQSTAELLNPATTTHRGSRLHKTGIPPVNRVIYSGPKTIVLWGDGTKTIVSCGEGDTYDHYSGFCAAVVKKLFGSTTHAKKVLGSVVQVQ